MKAAIVALAALAAAWLLRRIEKATDRLLDRCIDTAIKWLSRRIASLQTSTKQKLQTILVRVVKIGANFLVIYMAVSLALWSPVLRQQPDPCSIAKDLSWFQKCFLYATYQTEIGNDSSEIQERFGREISKIASQGGRTSFAISVQQSLVQQKLIEDRAFDDSRPGEIGVSSKLTPYGDSVAACISENDLALPPPK